MTDLRLFLVALALPAMFADDATLRRPVGVCAFADGAVFALQEDGALVRVARQNAAKTVAGIPWTHSPVDLACSEVDGQRTVFVVTTGLRAGTGGGSQSQNSVLYAYDLRSGKLASSPYNNRRLSSIVADNPRKRLLLADLTQAEILSVDVVTRSLSRLAAGALPTRRPGCLAIDASGGMLLLGDMLDGGLYLLDLQGKKSRTITQAFGDIRGIAMEVGGTQAYIADGVKGAVWKVQLGKSGNAAAPQRLSGGGGLRRPSGVALVSASEIVVSDTLAGKVVWLAK